jgi:hypothetical protein
VFREATGPKGRVSRFDRDICNVVDNKRRDLIDFMFSLKEWSRLEVCAGWAPRVLTLRLSGHQLKFSIDHDLPTNPEKPHSA